MVHPRNLKMLQKGKGKTWYFPELTILCLNLCETEVKRPLRENAYPERFLHTNDWQCVNVGDVRTYSTQAKHLDCKWIAVLPGLVQFTPTIEP